MIHFFIMASRRKNLSFTTKNELIEKFKKSNHSKAVFAKANSLPRMILNSILAAKVCFSSVEIGDQEIKASALVS